MEEKLPKTWELFGTKLSHLKIYYGISRAGLLKPLLLILVGLISFHFALKNSILSSIGTNDFFVFQKSQFHYFEEVYKDFISFIRSVYGEKVHIFAACGPMQNIACEWVSILFLLNFFSF